MCWCPACKVPAFFDQDVSGGHSLDGWPATEKLQLNAVLCSNREHSMSPWDAIPNSRHVFIELFCLTWWMLGGLLAGGWSSRQIGNHGHGNIGQVQVNEERMLNFVLFVRTCEMAESFESDIMALMCCCNNALFVGTCCHDVDDRTFHHEVFPQTSDSRQVRQRVTDRDKETQKKHKDPIRQMQGSHMLVFLYELLSARNTDDVVECRKGVVLMWVGTLSRTRTSWCVVRCADVSCGVVGVLGRMWESVEHICHEDVRWTDHVHVL